VEVEQRQTVFGFKEMFARTDSIAVILQRVFFNGRELKDNRVLEECGVVPGSLVQIYLGDPSVFPQVYPDPPSLSFAPEPAGSPQSTEKSERNMNLILLTVDGKMSRIRVNSHSTIKQVKEKMHAELNISWSTHRLIYNDQELVDKANLSHYGIEEGSHLRVEVIVRGGGE